MSQTATPESTGNPALDQALENLRTVTEEHATLANELRELRDAGGAHDKRLKSLEDNLRKLEDVEQRLERIADKVARADAPVNMTEKNKKDFAIGKVAQALFRDFHNEREPWRDAELEREVVEEAHRKVQDQVRQIPVSERTHGTVIEEKAGMLVPSMAIPDFTELLRAQLVLPTLGARVVNDLVGHRVQIPGLNTGVVSAWYGESVAIAESEATFKARYLEPHRIGTHVRLANNLLRWSPMAVQDILETDMVESMAVKMENGFLFGTEVGEEPLGLVNDPDVTQITIGPDGNTGGRFSIRTVPDLEYELESRNHRIGDDAGFLFGPGPKRLLKKEGVEQFSAQGVDAGQPYVVPGISDQALGNLLGYRFASTSAVPTDLTKGSATGLTYVIFALWRQLMIGHWGGLRMRASNQASFGSNSAFLQDETWIVAERTVDALLRRPDAAVVVTDALNSV